jgi:CO/xanthine dehydrogenase FAD-binding subunit
MHMDYDLELPDRLDDALGILAAPGDRSTIALAGGTNLIVDMRAGRERPELVVSLDRIDALRGIEHTENGVSIGGRTTVSELLRSPEVAKTAPALVAAANVFAGRMVRNAATVGGNIACGSPAADLVPPLLALDAEVTLTSASGSRTVALDDYFLGYREDVRRPDELIAAISWDHLPDDSASLFYKLARRKGDAITITGVAVTLCAADGVCSRARIALGAVAPTVFRAKAAEAMLEGTALTPELIAAAAAQAAAESAPIDDVRASADYRRHTTETLTRRLITQAWERID